ncbi:hypothetical protein BGX28_007348 [Mortierella sp. GBA30]|nr:hypothetical protein BGX28_007348 [Mortierella sp. GBA30]
MHFSTLAIVATIVVAASAQTEKYPFKPNGPCIQACLVKAGKGLMPNYSLDENSPYFMESLKLDHERENPKYQDMMVNAGICMGPCPVEEQELYRQQFQDKVKWYQTAKASAGNGGNGGAATATTTAASSSSTSATVPPSTGGVVAPTGSAVPSSAASSAPSSGPSSATGSKPTEAPKSSASAVASGLVGVTAALLSAIALL